VNINQTQCKPLARARRLLLAGTALALVLMVAHSVEVDGARALAQSKPKPAPRSGPAQRARRPAEGGGTESNVVLRKAS